MSITTDKIRAMVSPTYNGTIQRSRVEQAVHNMTYDIDGLLKLVKDLSDRVNSLRERVIALEQQSGKCNGIPRTCFTCTHFNPTMQYCYAHMQERVSGDTCNIWKGGGEK